MNSSQKCSTSPAQYPIESNEIETAVQPPARKIRLVNWSSGHEYACAASIYRMRTEKAIQTNDLDALMKLGSMVSTVLRTRVVGIFMFDDDTKIPHVFKPNSYTGEIEVRITAYPHGFPTKRPKVATLTVDDLSRVEIMVLDRLLVNDHLEVTYSLPDTEGSYTQEYHNRDVAGLGGPTNARQRVVANITENYHSCRLAVSEALAKSSMANYSAETGIYTYLLFDFYALGGNLERLEAALKLSGWRHVKFTEHPHSTLLELK